MARLSLLLLCLMLCLVSVAQEQLVSYSISGTVPAGVTTVFLNTPHNEPIDTAMVVNGKFQIAGSLLFNSFVTLTDNGSDLPLNMLIDGTPVEVNMERSVLKGSKLNERLNKVDREISDLTIDYMQLQMDYAQVPQWQTVLRDSLRRVTTAAFNKVVVEMKNVIRTNSDNVIPALYLSQIYNTLTVEELKEYLSEDHVYASHPLCVGAWRTLNHYEKTNIGTRYTDLVMADTTGLKHQLSEYVGKGNYVLIDFWASWCAPCMLEMENVKAVYQKYHEKGFEIVGLSFDRGRQPWVSAIAHHNLNWIHLSDLKYWNSEASIVYGISSIPANILVDGKGFIVATDLRGQELSRKLRQIYKY
ncbi:MAG: AhpC/TSA family protein [Bacteroidaceae bacterium]|nr:AhpC/TSA family protein [Bacteroidaceae bacterium]